ncbi:MAG: type II secretion system F family protein [Zhaonellaceae bacterium]|jgi:tight adherence protein C
MIYLAALSSGALVFCLTLLYLQIKNRDKLLLENRLVEFTMDNTPQDAISAELNLPFRQRVLKPVLYGLAKMISRLIPFKQDSLDKELILAGRPGNLTPQEFGGLQGMLACFFGGVAFFINYLRGARNIFLPLGFGFLGYYLPKFYLKQRRAERIKTLEKELPQVLDLLTVCVEAGLGFDAALSKVVEKSRSLLAQEFRRVLQEIKIGKPRREALKNMAERLKVDDLSNFIGAVVQADQLGVSMANMLRLQAQVIRQKRRQGVEEEAMKAPVKMLLPLVLFIFPCIFIVVLGPAVIQFLTQISW